MLQNGRDVFMQCALYSMHALSNQEAPINLFKMPHTGNRWVSTEEYSLHGPNRKCALAAMRCIGFAGNQTQTPTQKRRSYTTSTHFVAEVPEALEYSITGSTC